MKSSLHHLWQIEGASTLRVDTSEDLSRHIVKSDSATFSVKELDFHIPAGRGTMSNIQGILQTAIDDLKSTQEERRSVDPDAAAQIDQFVANLALYAAGIMLPFHIVVNDPAGNSFVENPAAPAADPNLVLREYVRTPEMNKALRLELENQEAYENNAASGAFVAPDGAKISREDGAKGNKGDEFESNFVNQEALRIPAECPNCTAPGESCMAITDIPFFREVIIMAFNCEKCGFKSNEVKGGGPISEKGKITTLRVGDGEDRKEDLGRDVIKSNTAGVTIPELEVEVTHGSLGGMYTTVEGLVSAIRDRLFEGEVGDFSSGDSATSEKKSKMKELKAQFDECVEGRRAFTLLLDDPLDSSFIFSPYTPNDDPRLSSKTYVRSAEMDEELGIADMCTEGYGDYDDDDDASASKTETKSVMETMSQLQVHGAKAHPNPTAVMHLDTDAFVPSVAFDGKRDGFYFGTGAHGLGYYKDAASN